MPVKKTGLYDIHVSLGAKMVEFAGYLMPIQYLMFPIWVKSKCGVPKLWNSSII
jgi:glycine cleavage system aminomethyltransferase T